MTKPTKIYLVPAVGEDGEPMLVRDPITREPLPARGAWKPRTRYWQRRIDDKSAIEAAPPARPEATPEAEATVEALRASSEAGADAARAIASALHEATDDAAPAASEES